MEKILWKCIYRMSWLAQDPANASPGVTWTFGLHHVPNGVSHDRREIIEDSFTSIIWAIEFVQEKILDNLNVVLVIDRVTKDS